MLQSDHSLSLQQKEIEIQNYDTSLITFDFEKGNIAKQ